MTTLRFPAPSYKRLFKALLADRSRESCAILYTRSSEPTGSWLVADVQIVHDQAYERRDALSAVLTPAFLVGVANRARKEKLGVVMVHTHPHAVGVPSFSPVDDKGEQALAEYFGRRAPHATHLALVIGPDGCRARRLGTQDPISVWQVGEDLAQLFEPTRTSEPSAHYDRQVRAFGELGQRLVSTLRVGLVGAGGTGSVTAQQLAYLGVSDFLVIDPDEITASNLNRLVGATRADVGQPKVEIARRAILQANPAAKIALLQRDVVDGDVAPALIDLDFIFLCTDSHASRAVVGQLAYQHLVPTIDMGVSITVHEAAVSHITGRVQMLAPGLPCLVCTQALDSEQIRREFLIPEQRAADPYVQGIHEPQPAVISLNSTMASLAVTMFLGAVTPIPARARMQLYDGVRGTVRPTSATRAPSCIVCSDGGSLARGSSWPLPVRPTRGAHD